MFKIHDPRSKNISLESSQYMQNRIKEMIHLKIVLLNRNPNVNVSTKKKRST